MELETKARDYHNTLTMLQRYQWAIYNSSKLETLVNDLKLYTNYLHKLTKDYFKADMLGQLLTPFSEFQVPFVPSHPLALKFCGRAEELLKMDDYLRKSQLARHFIEVNKDNYTAILWVHAADCRTIGTSSTRILKELIAHYATNSIATDLRIPGQIDSSGEPIGDVAENTWNYIQNWLAGQNNLSWCLVFDSVDTEPEIERLNNLIPCCTHGHVIITSRLRVRDHCAKIISVSGLDRSASIKLLLGDRKGDAIEAGKVSDALGHLPIALSQAAAYIVKRELNFTQCLKRLSDNCTRLLGTAYLKYTEGVFSCWKLSVEALMRSNPHAIDLLRLCSFLSPDGVSEELLHRGVEGIEWAQDVVCGRIITDIPTRRSITARRSRRRPCYILPDNPQSYHSFQRQGSIILDPPVSPALGKGFLF
ncbi:hypothetical protein TWF225_004422 [Orbilia oligospora]|nr:hypothetical protein TWF225_004422 [Orbilia oligospora]KAF3267544.1 hypothetical protein TWF128_009081 [Orbilia oligospora]KAF3269238.1 hypothetical protein TWF217_009329 [Orbilia oligospora]